MAEQVPRHSAISALPPAATFRIPAEHREQVVWALGRYSVGVVSLLLRGFLDGLAEPSGVALADYVELMTRSTESRLDDLLKREAADITGEDFASLKKRLLGEALGNANTIEGSHRDQAASALAQQRAEFLKRVEALNDELMQALSVIETTDDAKHALREILGDLSAVARMSVSLIELFGAASNPDMPELRRAETARRAVERMGPLFIKMMQTFVNMDTLLRELSPRTRSATFDEPVLKGLKQLRDNVTPVPWEQIRAQIERSLCKEGGPQLHELFPWISEKPLASGSIGQVHEARAVVDGKLQDLVVKVLRPGVRENFDEILRITELTLSVFRELLAMDPNGRLLGPLKDSAEQALPTLEQALRGFIDSFRVETEFRIEVANMEAFRELTAADTRIAIPRVFHAQTGGDVLTMEKFKGFPIEPWLKRVQYARGIRPIAEELGRVADAADAEARVAEWIGENFAAAPLKIHCRSGLLNHRVHVTLADGSAFGLLVSKRSGKIHVLGQLPDIPPQKARLLRWAERAFGAHAQACELTKVDGGHRVIVRFDNRVVPFIEAFVRDGDRGIEPRTPLPDLSEHGVRALSRRLIVTTASQLLRGMLHGDPHAGNLFVMPDGKTIGLLDFGLAIKLKLHDARGPLRLMAAAFLQEPEHMANAMLTMVDPSGITDAARANMETGFRTLLADAETHATAGMGPLPSRWHWLDRQRYRAALNLRFCRGWPGEALNAHGLLLDPSGPRLVESPNCSNQGPQSHPLTPPTVALRWSAMPRLWLYVVWIVAALLRRTAQSLDSFRDCRHGARACASVPQQEPVVYRRRICVVE